MYTYTYIHLHMDIFTYIHIYIYTYLHLYIYTFTHLYIYIYVHMYIYIYILWCVCSFIIIHLVFVSRDHLSKNHSLRGTTRPAGHREHRLQQRPGLHRMASAFWSKSLLEPEARRQNRWRVWNGLNECEVSCSFTWNMLPSKTLRWFGVFKMLLG